MDEYNFGYDMNGKMDFFPYGGGFTSSPEDYEDWARQLADEDWITICRLYDRDYQCAILRAITVRGIRCEDWTWYFYKVVHSCGVFEDFDKEFQQGTLAPDWVWFADRIPTISGPLSYMPCPVPEWLWEYGYTQSQYLDDLARMWINIDPLYYRPWPGAQSNPISHEIAKIHLAGKEARWEIDETARHYRKRQSTYQ